MKETIFHKIIKGEIPSHKLYEDNDVFVILDAFPVAIGHTLILPKKYSENLIDIDGKTFEILMEKSRLIAKKIIKKLNVKGFTLVVNNHESSNQKVFYTHVHILPAKSEYKKTDFTKLNKILKIKSL